jgi:hypothetical protein
LGYLPGEPGDDRVPCVVNEIGFADPHTEHNQYKILVMKEISYLENITNSLNLNLFSVP